MKEFWVLFGAWQMGAATEKWFVFCGWPDTTVYPAIIFTAVGLAALAYGTMTEPTSQHVQR